MFLHPERLQHVLEPERYFAPNWHEAEMRHLLLPGWHFVATTDQLRRDGDSVSLELLGRPVIVRRADGEEHAFLNVRRHRVVEYRAERCGNLVFVNLSEGTPSLRDQMGATFDIVERAFSAPFRQIWTWQASYAANWKIPLENGVESYHIPCLHQKTFGNYPVEANVAHELQPGWTSYRTDEMNRWVKASIRSTTSWLGVPYTGDYTHYHVFPNLTFALMDLMSLAQIVVPTSPTTSRTMVWLFAPFGPRRGILPWLHAKGNALASKAVARRILAEDAPIFPAVQQGIESSPVRGVIGRREERVWAFQDYVARLSEARQSG